MSTLPATPSTYRHPLGLPAGSVRAILALAIVGLMWLILLLPEDRLVSVPLHLHALLALVLVFFAAHGDSIGPRRPGESSPLYLPRGTLRFVLLAGSAAVVAWAIYRHPEMLEKRLIPRDVDNWPYVLVALFGGYMLGYVIGCGPWRRLAAFQDLQAWVSLLAILGIAVDMILYVINVSVAEPMHLEIWQMVLTGVVAFYFGVRS